MAERGEASAIPIEVMEMVDEFIWTLEDTAAFVGGRVAAAIRRYVEGMLPPLAKAMMEVHPGVRVFVAHARPPGRHGVPQVAGRPDLLRLLRREPAAPRPLDQRRELGLAARSHGPDRRAREVRGARVRRAPHVLRHERHVDVESRDLHGGRGQGPDRAVRPQLSQVDRAQPRHDGRRPDLLRAAAQPLRNHRPHSAGAAAQGSDQGRDQGQPARDRRVSRRARSIRSSRTPPTTGCATTRAASRSCSTRASTAFISTRPGTRTRASIRSIAIGMRCTAIRRTTKARPCSRRTPRTSCWPRSRKRRSCTSATAAARFRIRASTSRS